jgi:penicillin-binding protein 1A
MRFFYYLFLALVSLGMLGLMAVVCGVIYAVSWFGHDLPDYSQLKSYQPPVITRVYAGDGRMMEEYAEEKRVFVPIDAIPDLVKHAFIAAEDKKFYKHHGVDYVAIARAAVRNFKNPGGRPEGASTITQQVAKNFLLSNEVSYKRKIREAILAYRLEKAMSKDRILELYLNEIFLGQRSYGVAAAALSYFNKSLEELSIEEAAYLAALPKAPSKYHPVRNHDEALIRRNHVIQRLMEDGYILPAQAEIAKAKPLQMVERMDSGIVDAPYFAEEVRRELQGHYGDEALYKGGLAVRTSADPRLQIAAASALRHGLIAFDRRKGWRGPVAHWDDLSDWTGKLKNIARPSAMLEEWDLAVVLDSGTLGLSSGKTARLQDDDAAWTESNPLKAGDVVMVEEAAGESPGKKSGIYMLRQIPKVNGALIAMNPHTGRVLAMQGGWSFDESSFNRATQAKRQPGSAFKPFIYLAALDKGFTPATLVLDAPIVIDQGPGLPKWRPSNYNNEYYGPTPLRVGVEKSRNLMTVRLAEYIGMDIVAEYAKKFGIADDMPRNLASSLGSTETTVLRLTTAYAMLVNGGKKITPTFVDRIQDRFGKTIFSHDKRACPGCGPLLEWDSQITPVIDDTRPQINDPRTTYEMVSILEGVVQRGTATRLKDMNRPLAGKTGTTNDSKDAWFVGFSPDLVAGVYVGYDEPKQLGGKETGASVAVPIFKEFMTEALKDAPIVPFRIPPGVRQVQINAETGARAKPGDKKIIWEAFVAGTEPTDKVYILDGNGINLMSSFQRDVPLPEGVDTEVISDLPPPDENGTSPMMGPKAPPATALPSSPAVMTGTGGLY